MFFGAPERTIVRNENWKWPALDLVYEGTDFKVYYKGKDESLFEGPYVRMGPVLYPLDRNAIGINTYSQDENWVGEDILILDVPIGAVNIQDSREALGYDDRTIAYLKSRLKEARKEIHAWYQAEIDQIDHIVTAAHFCPSTVTSYSVALAAASGNAGARTCLSISIPITSRSARPPSTGTRWPGAVRAAGVVASSVASI